MPLRRDFLGFRFAISLFFVHGPRSGKLAKVINAKVGTMDWGHRTHSVDGCLESESESESWPKDQTNLPARIENAAQLWHFY